MKCTLGLCCSICSMVPFGTVRKSSSFCLSSFWGQNTEECWFNSEAFFSLSCSVRSGSCVHCCWCRHTFWRQEVCLLPPLCPSIAPFPCVSAWVIICHGEMEYLFQMYSFFALEIIQYGLCSLIIVKLYAIFLLCFISLSIFYLYFLSCVAWLVRVSSSGSCNECVNW